jgi:hypothetical protein
MVAATRVVNGVKRRGARTRSKAKANVVEDRSIPRSAAAPRTSANPASATTPSFQFKHARWSWAAGITAYGHWSRQKRDIRRNQVDRTLFSRNDVSKGTT